MPSQTKSKAQRRSDAQQRAAERRAAELRAKRVKTGLRTGGVVVVVGVVALIIILVTGGSTTIPPSEKNPHIATVAIPKSLVLAADPATTVGPEGINMPVGNKLADLS